MAYPDDFSGSACTASQGGRGGYNRQADLAMNEVAIVRAAVGRLEVALKMMGGFTGLETTLENAIRLLSKASDQAEAEIRERQRT